VLLEGRKGFGGGVGVEQNSKSCQDMAKSHSFTEEGGNCPAAPCSRDSSPSSLEREFRTWRRMAIGRRSRWGCDKGWAGMGVPPAEVGSVLLTGNALRGLTPRLTPMAPCRLSAYCNQWDCLNLLRRYTPRSMQRGYASSQSMSVMYPG